MKYIKPRRNPVALFPSSPPPTLKMSAFFIKTLSKTFRESSIHPPKIFYSLTQTSTYVDVYMKWKKDSYFDSIEHIHNSTELQKIISLKNCISREDGPTGSIPVSIVSKRGLEFGISMNVARFMRLYPSFFDEFRGEFNHPWFRLTQEAIELDEEERAIYKDWRTSLVLRLKKFVLMSRENVVPLKIVKGMQWYLGFPDEYLKDLEQGVPYTDCFRISEMGDELKGLSVVGEETQRVLSVLESNAAKRGAVMCEFPLFPSRGLRLRRKIEDWMNEFQKVPYISPYEDFSEVDPNSDVSEKRVVGVLHELFSLFVDNAAERKKLLCLKKYLGLPQKFHKVFERHPHMFYLSLKNKTCTAILKEAYCDNLAIEKHPLLKVRKKYIRLMKGSQAILKTRRVNNQFFKHEVVKDLDYATNDDEREVL